MAAISQDKKHRSPPFSGFPDNDAPCRTLLYLSRPAIHLLSRFLHTVCSSNKVLTAFLLFLLPQSLCHGAEAPKVNLEDFIEQGVYIDLKDPEFSDGILKSDQGGVISAPNVRIQGTCISYQKTSEGTLITAEGELLVQFFNWAFTGERLIFNLNTNTGTIEEGRCSIEPWFLGGKIIRLEPDGSYTLFDGYITTSQTECHEWEILIDKARLDQCRDLACKDVTFKIMRVPMLWIPKFKINLDTIFDSPIKYTVRFGGQEGAKLGVAYEIFSWKRLKTFLRLDWRLNRGLGGGIETDWSTKDRRHSFQSISYIANDNSISNPHEKTRYRLKGVYLGDLPDDKTSIKISYDKLSDKDMAEDYYDESFKIDEPGRTELYIHHEEPDWVSNFLTRVQINDFQSLKQELPTFSSAMRPFNLFQTGILSNYSFKLSYLDYDYASSLQNVSDYHSTRYELNQEFLRPIPLASLGTLTPSAALNAIYYGDSPSGTPKELLSGIFGLNWNLQMWRRFENVKHVLTPYLDYTYITFPSTDPSRHYIFDIDDGWYRLNTLKFGVQNALYFKNSEQCIKKALDLDIYSYAFFDTETIPDPVPRLYMKAATRLFENVNHFYTLVLNLERSQIDSFNWRVEWTVSSDLAFATEWRTRGPASWRKVDSENFILESYRTNEELLHSSLSDERDTLLYHIYYRFSDNLALELQSRTGWRRKHEPSYNEYQIDLHTSLGSFWNLKISYQHREDDERLAFYFKLSADRPSKRDCRPVPCIEF